MSGLSEADQAFLGGLAEQLHARAPGSADNPFGVPPWIARIYVQAVFTRRDPVRELGRRWFGEGFPLFDGDPVWADEETRRRSRTFACIAKVEACAAVRLNIPVRGLAA